ncbi:hypothetical protein LKR43_16015, partial [Pusillimonas sp. MFBS29]|uniref:hypothetical protein n=1 Tax=Pusillimonas sp. MFBS29 TaxID=2886690 RepID=UPI001D0F84E1
MKQFFSFVKLKISAGQSAYNHLTKTTSQTCHTTAALFCASTGESETIPCFAKARFALFFRARRFKCARSKQSRLNRRHIRVNPDVLAAKEQNYSIAFLTRAT